ncbi:MAG TPA: hypothetical protein PKV16_03465 [Caldisericia bacterium]|nr:hypothetical protein [Caldisericia bacterium]
MILLLCENAKFIPAMPFDSMIANTKIITNTVLMFTVITSTK